MSDDVVEIVPSVEIDYEQNPVTIEPEVSETEQIESVDPAPSCDIPSPSGVVVDSIHAAATAIAAINARLDKIDPPKEGNDAQA